MIAPLYGRCARHGKIKTVRRMIVYRFSMPQPSASGMGILPTTLMLPGELETLIKYKQIQVIVNIKVVARYPFREAHGCA